MDKILKHTTFLFLLAVGSMLFSACISPVQSLPTMESPTQVETEIPLDAPTEESSPRIFLDTGKLAAGFWVDTIPAVPDNGNAPYWEVLPEYAQATLDGYTISSHLMQPQVFVYPVKELIATNEGAASVVESLRILLETPQEVETMPFLPLFNAQQVMHSQVQSLDFQNGRGLRFLTFMSQGIMPINNYELFYTFQGFTNDGNYYIAAILPVNHPSLPADGMMTGNEPENFINDHQAYIAGVAQSLNEQAIESFTPDLSLLDALVASLEIK